jgi:putative peptidoglycan lipid II flippase
VFTQLANFVLVPRLAHAGLALSIGLGAGINALALLVILLRRGVYVPQPGWLAFGLRLALAVGLLAATLVWVQRQFDWMALASWLDRAFYLGALIGLAAMLYLGLLGLLGFRLSMFQLKR